MTVTIQPDADLLPFWQELVVPQNADATLAISLFKPGTTTPYDLTNAVVTVVVKPSRYVPDAQGQTFTATITSITGGTATLVIPAASIPAPGTQWYRVDVTSGTNRISPIFGPFVVESM